MKAERARSGVTGLLVCGAVVAGFVSLRFARSVLVAMLERSGMENAALPRLTVFAQAITHPAILAPVLLACIVAVTASTLTARTEGARLLVQIAVLVLLVLLLAVTLAGLLMPFHIPDVRLQ
jgi:hypothetical protein